MIRLATKADIDKIWQLRLDASALLKSRNVNQWQHEEPSVNHILHEIEQGSFYVYEVNHEIIGMIYLMHEIEETYLEIDGNWHYDLPYLTIHRLAVKQDYLKKGIADELMNYSIKYAKDHQIDVIRIDTHEDNKHAQRLFQKYGFEYCGVIMLSFRTKGDRKRLAYDLFIGE